MCLIMVITIRLLLILRENLDIFDLDTKEELLGKKKK